MYRAANQLNWGYYGRSEAGMNAITLADGSKIAFAPTINDGTAGVQTYLAGRTDTTYDSWLQAAGPTGFLATYEKLFGSPFAFTVDPLWPDDLRQPPLQLPLPAAIPGISPAGRMAAGGLARPGRRSILCRRMWSKAVCNQRRG
ncbi:MAG: hypothetical protein M5U34_32035 [Chloroflexi bacterium]|nr:hypothetical protein [Chloroflexota bacterium]